MKLMFFDFDFDFFVRFVLTSIVHTVYDDKT